MWKELREILSKIVHLENTTDIRGTIDSIRNSIEIRGYNVWILACGAMLASIGLDTNSAAVIIGAMLISPLMSPILGIGLSIGINDTEHLKMALKSFGTAVISVLLVSSLYFLLTPFGTPTDEILARTYPTTLDVLIAIFGGIAGIVAGSRKEKTNAIPGVAIATALMPPLCTAGFGLAKMEWGIFLGASYLFFINSVFIALSTYLIVRFLRFPYVDYVDGSTKRKATTWIAIFAILVILPSSYSLIKLIRQDRIERSVSAFIEQVVNNDNHQAVQHKVSQLDDSTQVLTLMMVGPNLNEDSLAYLSSRLEDFSLGHLQLRCLQNQAPIDADEVRSQSTLEAMQAIQPSIDALQANLDSMQTQLIAMKQDSVPLKQLESEIQALFPELAQMVIAQDAINTDFTSTDTIPTVLVKWKPNTPSRTRRSAQKKFQAWIQTRMELDTVQVVSW
ncbi:MAG: DUF389 domain-containing protein [Bacteroidota bacterium]